MLEVRNLVKNYGDKTAVHDISFHIESGEIVGLLGLNGAGKSTTMNCITGYIAPTEGQIIVDGHDLLKEPEQAKRVMGYLPEMFSYYPDMKVHEYLNFICDLKGFTKNRGIRREHIREICRKVGLSERSARMIRNLSKGYKQRVGFAQALIGNPKVLILDEPTVGLDPSQIVEIRQLIRDSGRESTVIVSSHILSEIQAICSRIIVIHDGVIAADGAPAELIERSVGSGEVFIRVREEKDRTEEIIRKIPSVTGFRLISGEERAYREYILNGSGEGDLREEIFLAFADARVPLLEIRSGEASLESLFLRLTGQTGEEK